MSLDFTSFANVVDRLGEGLVRYLSNTSDTQIRDGLIQRFEFTYDLSHKMLRRAGGRPKPWSDLDLPLEGPALLPIAALAQLAEAFDESALPFKVDLVDRKAVSAAFGAIIDASALPLPR